jgi:hypothetical protein
MEEDHKLTSTEMAQATDCLSKLGSLPTCPLPFLSLRPMLSLLMTGMNTSASLEWASMSLVSTMTLNKTVTILYHEASSVDLSGNTIQRSLKISGQLVISGSILMPWQLVPLLTIHPHAQLSIPRTLACPQCTTTSSIIHGCLTANKEHLFISKSHLELEDLFNCP